MPKLKLKAHNKAYDPISRPHMAWLYWDFALRRKSSLDNSDPWTLLILPDFHGSLKVFKRHFKGVQEAFNGSLKAS